MKKKKNHSNKILLKIFETKNFNAGDIGLISEELVNGKYNKL
jgi:hypothetical protein